MTPGRRHSLHSVGGAPSRFASGAAVRQPPRGDRLGPPGLAAALPRPAGTPIAEPPPLTVSGRGEGGRGTGLDGVIIVPPGRGEGGRGSAAARVRMGEPSRAPKRGSCLVINCGCQ